MFSPFHEIVGGRRMTGTTNGNGASQPDFVVLEHQMPDGSTLFEHQWRYPEPEIPEEAPPSAETGPADAG